MPKRPKRNRALALEAGETWCDRAHDLTERFKLAHKAIDQYRDVIFDALAGRASYLCRTNGQYPGDFSMWYRTKGAVVQIDHAAQHATVYSSLNEAIDAYAQLQAPHNIAARQMLLAMRRQDTAYW